MVAYWSLAVGIVLMISLATVLRSAIRNGTLERNGTVGFRTRATLASDEAWQRGHEATLPYLRLMQTVGTIFLGSSLITAIAYLITGKDFVSEGLIVPVAGFVVQLVAVILGAVKANAAAKSV